MLDGRDRLVQADSEGVLVPATGYGALRADIAPLLLMVRGKRACLNGSHDRHAGRPLLPNSTVRTTARAVHETHLTMVGGRPAAVSAMLIKPSTVGIREAESGLAGPHQCPLSRRKLHERAPVALPHRCAALFAPCGAPAGRSGRAARDEAGRRLGYIIWKPELPGSRILDAVLPFAISALALLALLMLLLTRSLKQTLNERAAFEARAAHLAYHDSLTGLPNRALLNERLQHSLAAFQRGGALSLLLIDLDRFKEVNERSGTSPATS